jgi:hypothetical protein
VRLLGQPAAKSGLRAFIHQWLSTNSVASIAKDPAIYPSFTPALAASMAGELDRYIDQVFWTGTGSLRELFTSSDVFVDPALAFLYGVSGPSVAGDYQSVRFPGNAREGVLTRAGFLAAHADNDSSGPVARGVFVLDSLLCTPPPPPPPDVPPIPPASASTSAHETTRQRFDAHLSDTKCRVCHTIIDGVGFGFEQFDGIGRYRTYENSHPVDTSGVLQGSDVDGPFVGVAALEAKLVASKEAPSCFLRQIVRYETGQADTDTSPHSAFATLDQTFSMEARVTDAIVSLVMHPAFVVRRSKAPNSF